MKRLFLLSISALLMLMAFVSCSEDEQYVAPADITITLTPNPCAPGDTVLAKLAYGKSGDNWYWYSSSFSAPTKVFGAYAGTCDQPSQCYFVAPEEAGEYPVSFKGQVTITAGKDLWGDRFELDTKLIVK